MLKQLSTTKVRELPKHPYTNLSPPKKSRPQVPNFKARKMSSHLPVQGFWFKRLVVIGRCSLAERVQPSGNSKQTTEKKKTM